MKKKVTSKPNTNAGEGLFFARRFIEENKGQLYIMSGLGQLWLNEDKMEIVDGPYWQGTLVSLIFNLSNIISAKDIFDMEFPEDAEDFSLGELL